MATKEVIHFTSDQIFTPSLDFIEMRTIIMALNHTDHNQVNVPDEYIQKIIYKLKWQIGNAVIQQSLNGDGVEYISDV